MKSLLMIAALLGGLAGDAHAQSSLQIYGNIDAGLSKRTGHSLRIGRRLDNTLGMRASEQLGKHLKGVFQLEMQFDPDTGLGQGPQRPLFEGQSRIGLAGRLGTLRIGRGLTALQESSLAFDPFHGISAPSGFHRDMMAADYRSEPDAIRFANAAFYNSPEYMGLQVNLSIGTREANGVAAAAASGLATPAAALANPYSISTTYKNGPIAMMLGHERNALLDRVSSLAGYVMVTPETKLMASLSYQDRNPARLFTEGATAWVLGANHTLGASKFLFGYGRKQADGIMKVTQFSLGYEYSLSKRSYMYVDFSSRKQVPALLPGAGSSTQHYSIGVNQLF